MKKIAVIILLILNVVGVVFGQTSSKFEYDEFITNESIKQNVLKVVKEYIGENITRNNSLVVKDDVSSKMRSYKVIQIFDVVSRKSDIYTVQVDVDEIQGEPRRLLFFDVKNKNGVLKLTSIRIGPRHLRQAEMQT